MWSQLELQYFSVILIRIVSFQYYSNDNFNYNLCDYKFGIDLIVVRIFIFLIYNKSVRDNFLS